MRWGGEAGGMERQEEALGVVANQATVALGNGNCFIGQDPSSFIKCIVSAKNLYQGIFKNPHYSLN